MIIVDSSVWVDFFNGVDTEASRHLDRTLGSELVAIGDLILAEVLQGFRSQSDYTQAKSLLLCMQVFDMLNRERALKVADNYRLLRRRGATVRKTTDMIIGTFCMEAGMPLLYSDRDFDPMVRHLTLRSAL